MVNVRSAVLNDLEPLSALLDGYRQFYKQPTDIQAGWQRNTAFYGYLLDIK